MAITTRARRLVNRFRAWSIARPTRLVAVVDAALVGASLLLALGSVVFAGFMVSRGNHNPNVNGLQYLAIFAQPRGATKPAEPEPEPAPRPLPRDEIDLSPVGAVRANGAGAPARLAGFALMSAQPGIAWLRAGSRIVAVRQGDAVPGLGRVAEIVQRDGRWILIGDMGVALLSSGASAAAGSPSARAPFNRRMIFGPEP